MTIDEKQRQVDAAWALFEGQKSVSVSEPTRPFKMDLPEKERSALKRQMYNDELSLNDREAAALALGWLVEQSRTTAVVTTHKGVKFTLYGFREAD